MQARYREAEAAYREACRLAPNSLDALLGLAQSLSFLNQHEEAMRLAQQARGIALGNIQKAAHELEAAIAPGDWKVYRALSHLIVFKQESPVFELVKTCIEKEGISDRDRADMHFLLGKAYLDIHKDEQAFFHYEEANRVMDGSLSPIQAEIEKRLTFTRRRFINCVRLKRKSPARKLLWRAWIFGIWG